MIAVIFEVEPHAGHQHAYFDIAADLVPQLRGTPGFISVERFESLSMPGKVLSLSFWVDEAALTAWRNTPQHRTAQAKGRGEIFRDYRIRVARVVRDYGQTARSNAPRDSQDFHGPDA